VQCFGGRGLGCISCARAAHVARPALSSEQRAPYLARVAPAACGCTAGGADSFTWGKLAALARPAPRNAPSAARVAAATGAGDFPHPAFMLIPRALFSGLDQAFSSFFDRCTHAAARNAGTDAAAVLAQLHTPDDSARSSAGVHKHAPSRAPSIRVRSEAHARATPRSSARAPRAGRRRARGLPGVLQSLSGSLLRSITRSPLVRAFSGDGEAHPTPRPPPPPPSRTNWTRLVPLPVLTGRVSYQKGRAAPAEASPGWSRPLTRAAWTTECD
jgi:hypothetical protein